jgi:hypothetical protein
MEKKVQLKYYKYKLVKTGYFIDMIKSHVKIYVLIGANL